MKSQAGRAPPPGRKPLTRRHREAWQGLQAADHLLAELGELFGPAVTGGDFGDVGPGDEISPGTGEDQDAHGFVAPPGGRRREFGEEAN